LVFFFFVAQSESFPPKPFFSIRLSVDGAAPHRHWLKLSASFFYFYIYIYLFFSHPDVAMSFRKRNIGISSGENRDFSQAPAVVAAAQSVEGLAGVRPSPDDGRPTTSTGSRSLDNLLAGHGGLPIGKLLFLEENGTTDFAGALLRYYAAEGIVQEHRVHVVGLGEQWGRALPGLTGAADSSDDKVDKRRDEKMKIAWRYERLGEFGTGIAGSRGKLHANDESSLRL
jgi:elongator complex protein 4